MKLSHYALVNWHLFPREDIDIAGDSGILGENRSGKSTLADGIQITFTGANSRFYKLNATASEGTRSERSIAGYCLGAISESTVLRKEARTYLCLAFTDPDGVKPPVSIGLAMEARQATASEEYLGRFVVVGRVLTTDDFVTVDDAGNAVPKPWDDVNRALLKEFGGRYVNHANRPLDYVREYMRWLVPSVGTSEAAAKAMLKAVVNALSMPHDIDANEFVRRYILESDPIKIAELRGSIQTYKDVTGAISTMVAKLDALDPVIEEADRHAAALNEKALEDYMAGRGAWLQAYTLNRSHRATIVAADEAVGARKEEIDDLTLFIQEEEDTITRLNVQIGQLDVKTGKQDKTEHLRLLESKLETVQRDLRARERYLSTVAALPAEMLREAGIAGVLSDLTRIITTEQPDGDVVKSSEQQLAGALARLASAVGTRRDAVLAEMGRIELKIGDIREKLGTADGRGGGYIDAATQRLTRALRQSNLAPRLLCDVVEIVDPEWASAAEGLLGGHRETIFVDRADFDAADRIAKSDRREFRGSTLASLPKIPLTGRKPEAGTFPSLFRTDDPDVMEYIIRRYGNVRLCQTLAEFNQPGRAIMPDGYYDDGLSRSHRGAEPNTYKIGMAAQMGRARELQDELADLEVRKSAADKGARAISSAESALQTLANPETASLSTLFATRIDTEASIRRVKAEIDGIEAQGDGGLRNKLAVHKDMLRRKRQELDDLNKVLDAHTKAKGVANWALGQGAGTVGSNLNLKLTRQQYLAIMKISDRWRGRLAYRGRLASRRAAMPVVNLAKLSDIHGDIATLASEAAAARQSEANRRDASIRNRMREYFDTFGQSAQIGVQSNIHSEIVPWAKVITADIRESQLPERQREADEAARTSARLFRTEFVNELTSRISRLDRDIRGVNRSLEERPFHGERYSFTRSQDPRYSPILRLIDIARENDEAIDKLFGKDLDPEDPHAEAIEAVNQLLEDPEFDFVAFEYYRKYFSFELQMTDIATGTMSRWSARRGTGSGAEQHTPIYVALASSLASVFGLRGRGQTLLGTGIALAMFDEAFSRLDVRNQRSMLDFLKSIGLQIILVAPIDKKQNVVGHLETIIEVERPNDGQLAWVESHYLKPKVREELEAIDPDNLDDQALRSILAAE